MFDPPVRSRYTVSPHPGCVRVSVCVCSRLCCVYATQNNLYRRCTNNTPQYSKTREKSAHPFKRCALWVYAMLCDAKRCSLCYAVLVCYYSICLYVCGAMPNCGIEEKRANLYIDVCRDREPNWTEQNRTDKSQRRIFNFCCFYSATRFLLWL